MLRWEPGWSEEVTAEVIAGVIPELGHGHQ